jgi:15-cis-phytoene synthase
VQSAIHDIYGFVRFADEIVDTFHEFDKALLLNEFKQHTFVAIERGISLNPILQSLQLTVNAYKIDVELIHAFFYSMQLDIDKKNYTTQDYQQYIYGSAEVVGLMCLQVFCNGNAELYKNLQPGAKSLGAAFQKINFLRDIKADFETLNRTYFPNCDFNNFTPKDKKNIEADIELDFKNAYQSILLLPNTAKFGVFVAYKYYYSLFKKIKQLDASKIANQRIRISNYQKAYIFLKAGVRKKCNLM